jgi:copper chaperone CopZ
MHRTRLPEKSTLMPCHRIMMADVSSATQKPSMCSAIFPERLSLVALYKSLQQACHTVTLILLSLIFLLTHPAISATPPSNGDEVRVIVKGVAVPYSVFGIIKRLEQIPGVAKVDFDMRHGLADIKLKPGAHITDEQLRAAIKNASYTPGDIQWIIPENDPAKIPRDVQPGQ